MMFVYFAMALSPQHKRVRRISGFVFVCFCLCYFFILLLLSGDIESNPGPRNNQQSIRFLYTNIRGLKSNLLELSIASKDYDILLCSETLVSNYRHSSELLIQNFKRPMMLLRNSIPRCQGHCIYVRSNFSASRFSCYECGCHEFMVVRVCSRFMNCYVFSIYRSPNTNNSIYDCLLIKMAEIQNVDRKAAFIFVGDLNAHHKEWLNSVSNTDQSGHAAFDFSSLSGCEQLVNSPTHQSGNCLDLLLTNVPGVVRVKVDPPIGRSDHCILACQISVGANIPNITISRHVFFKSKANWDNIRDDLLNLQWRNVFNAPCPVSSLNVALLDIISRRIPSKVIKNKINDKPWFNEECQQAFIDKQSAYRLWTHNRSDFCWNNYKFYQTLANDIYERARADYNSHLTDVLSSTTSSHRWWSALKSSLFGMQPSISPLSREDGSITYEPLEKANLLLNNFNAKQSNQFLNLPATCHPEPKLKSLAFRSSEMKMFLDALDSYGGVDPNGLLSKKWQT